MLVSEIKPIGKFGKNMLENEEADELIYRIIEKPLQNACKACKDKNIETVMSSANKNNIMTRKQKRINKLELKQMLQKNKLLNFEYVGKGYAWIMINYNTLSDENRKRAFDLENELGEDSVLFVKENYTDTKNFIRRKLKLKEVEQVFDDKYADEFKKRQLKLVYKNTYPSRNVFIRMPIDETTKVQDVDLYFKQIISKFEEQ